MNDVSLNLYTVGCPAGGEAIDSSAVIKNAKRIWRAVLSSGSVGSEEPEVDQKVVDHDGR